MYFPIQNKRIQNTSNREKRCLNRPFEDYKNITNLSYGWCTIAEQVLGQPDAIMPISIFFFFFYVKSLNKTILTQTLNYKKNIPMSGIVPSRVSNVPFSYGIENLGLILEYPKRRGIYQAQWPINKAPCISSSNISLI